MLKSLNTSQPSSRCLHVLLADDNRVNQRVAQLLLERLGHSVTVAGTGRQALNLWARGVFDLTLMDLEMPEMGGLETAAAIRAQGGEQPIIAVTARTLAGERERRLQHGMDDYLQKPFQPAEVAAALTRFGEAAHCVEGGHLPGAGW